jgi:hypothetical protein
MEKTFGEQMVVKFTGLIKSASKMYWKAAKSNYLDYDDFMGRGFLTLATCLDKWKDPTDEEGFAKYFKSSLYYKYQSMLHKAFAKKRTAQFISIDELEQRSSIALLGRSWKKNERIEVGAIKDIDTEFKELVDHVMSRLTSDLERKIFELWVDPPEELCSMAVMENRRKIKACLIRKVPMPGINSVMLTNGIVVRYLKEQGYPVSQQKYNLCFKEIKCKVKEIVKEERV